MKRLHQQFCHCVHEVPTEVVPTEVVPTEVPTVCYTVHATSDIFSIIFIIAYNTNYYVTW